MTRICIFEGDDAAPEAIGPTVDLLERLDTGLEFEKPSIEDHTDALAEGRLPRSIQKRINTADTVLFGAASDIHKPIIKYLRNEYGCGLPANVRPVRYIEGAMSPLADPEGIDYVIIRENLEGLYFRAEGELQELVASSLDLRNATVDVANLGDGTYAVRVASEQNIRWLASFACNLAIKRTHNKPAYLTCATKSNILPETDGLFEAIIEETSTNYNLEYEHLHADDLGQQLLINPRRFNVIVTPNLTGDLLSDVGAGTVGGLGLAPSGCYGDNTAYFEPVHGSAPDIAGKGIINPTATILSAVLMLKYLDHEEAAAQLEQAVEMVYAKEAVLTPDQGGSASTVEMTDAIAQHL